MADNCGCPVGSAVGPAKNTPALRSRRRLIPSFHLHSVSVLTAGNYYIGSNDGLRDEFPDVDDVRVEIAARIASDLFEDLDAPVRRVAAMDTFVAYQPLVEDEILPQPDDFYTAMKELAEY